MSEERKDVCRLCGKDCFETPGYLRRVNEKGVPGIWECSPSCNSPRKSEDERVLSAIEGGDQ